MIKYRQTILMKGGSPGEPVPGRCRMSKFSTYLKALIDRSGESIAAVSRSTGAERTSIHKALSDERVLSSSVVSSMAQHFHLSIEERKEFFRLYDMLLVGEERYHNRQAVCDLFNHLSAIQYQMTPPPEGVTLPEENRLIRGEYAVHSAIRAVLTYEIQHNTEAEFQFFIPDALDLTMDLMELWLDGGKFRVSQLLCFPASADRNVVQNINLLKQIIPLCLASRGRYSPWYFYERPRSLSLDPMGCYIVTPNYLIQFDESLSVAQIDREKERIGYYNQYFRNLLHYCDPLTRCSTNLMEILQEYLTHTSKERLIFLMSQPCPGKYITANIIEKYLRAPGLPYQQVFDMVDHRFSALRSVGDRYLTIFSEKGLEELLETRALEDLPEVYVPPLDFEDLYGMLLQMREEIAEGTLTGLIVRPTYLRLPDYLCVDADPKTGIHIYTTNHFIYGAYCCNIHIAEESVCRAFLDFFESLQGSQMVYSKEETLSILDGRLAAAKERYRAEAGAQKLKDSKIG